MMDTTGKVLLMVASGHSLLDLNLAQLVWPQKRRAL
jgi:hypothetical protein